MVLLICYALELLDFPKLIEVLFLLENLIFCLIECFLFLNDVAVLRVGTKVFFNYVIFQIFLNVLLVYDLELLRKLSNIALNYFVNEEAGWLFFKVAFDLRLFNLRFTQSILKRRTFLSSFYSSRVSSNILFAFFFNNSSCRRHQ